MGPGTFAVDCMRVARRSRVFRRMRLSLTTLLRNSMWRTHRDREGGTRWFGVPLRIRPCRIP